MRSVSACARIVVVGALAAAVLPGLQAPAGALVPQPTVQATPTAKAQPAARTATPGHTAKRITGLDPACHADAATSAKIVCDVTGAGRHKLVLPKGLPLKVVLDGASAGGVAGRRVTATVPAGLSTGSLFVTVGSLGSTPTSVAAGTGSGTLVLAPGGDASPTSAAASTAPSAPQAAAPGNAATPKAVTAPGVTSVTTTAAPKASVGRATVSYVRLNPTISLQLTDTPPGYAPVNPVKAWQYGRIRYQMSGPDNTSTPTGDLTIQWTSNAYPSGTGTVCTNSASNAYHNTLNACLIGPEVTEGGLHSMIATYPGDAGYSNFSFSQSVVLGANTVGVTAAAHLAPTDGALTLDATVTPVDSGNFHIPQVHPDGLVDGTVSWTSQPANPQIAAACPPTTFGPVSSAIIGKAVSTPTCRIPNPIPGAYAVTAVFTPRNGMDTFPASSSAMSYSVLKYPTTTGLAVRPSTVDARGTAVASVSVTPPVSAGVDLSGTVTVSPAAGSTAPANATGCSVAVTATAGQKFTGSCPLVLHGNQSDSAQDYVATFVPDTAGDPYFTGSASGTSPVSVTRLPTVVAVSPSDTQPAFGDDVTLALTVTANGDPVAGGRIEMFDGDPTQGGTLLGYSNVDGTGTASFVDTRPSAGRHDYYAVYSDTAGSSDYLGSTGQAPTVTVDRLHATLALVAADNPAAATSAGVPVTVTATLPLPAGASAAASTIAITDSTGTAGTCAAQTGTTTLTRGCTFVEQPGNQPSFRATYQDAGVVADPGAVTWTVSPSPTRTTATASSSVYGVAPVLAGTVTPVVAHTDLTGTVAFVLAGRTLCSTSLTVSAAVGAQAVSCSPTSAVDAGSATITAIFTPDPSATPYRAAGSTSSPASLVVAPAPVDLAIKVRPVGGSFAVDVTTSVDKQGAAAPVVVGAVAFGDAASGCATMTLDANGTARCLAATTSTAVTYSAHFVPTPCTTVAGVRSTGCNFVAGPAGSVTTTYNPQTGPCFGRFGAFFTAVRGGTAHTYSLAGGDTATVTVTGIQPGDTCRQDSQLSATASVSLFGGTLRGTALGATVTAADGLCLTGGTLLLATNWNAGPLRPLAADPICFALTPTDGLAPATSGTLALATGSTARLPLVNVPDVSSAVSSLHVGVTPACAGSRAGQTAPCASTVPALDVSATVDATAGAPGAQFTARVFTDGTIHGDLATTAISLFGSSTTLHGTVDRAGSAALTVDVTGGFTADASPTAGLTLLPAATALRLTDLGTVTVSDAARVGSSTRAVAVGVTGGLTSFSRYSLPLAGATRPATWTPVDGLSFAPALAGTLTRDTSGSSFTLGGTASGASSLWTAPNGITFGVDSVSVGSGWASADARCGYTGSGVATLRGTVSAHGLSLPGTACVDLVGGGWHLGVSDGRAELTSPDTAAMDLRNLTIDSARPAGGAVTTTGSADASVTAGSLAVTARVALLLSTDRLVAGGSVVTDSLGLPASSAYLAYATAPVAGFDTGLSRVGSRGRIDLPAGTSVFGAVALPAAVVATLSAAGLAAPTTGVLTFSGPLPRDGAPPRFVADLPTPGALPFLTLPAGTRVGSVSVAYSGGVLSLTTAGTVPGDDGASAPIAQELAIAGNGAVTGGTTVRGLHAFGRVLDLSGSLTRSTGATVSSTVHGVLDGRTSVGSVVLNSVDVSLGAKGFRAAGTLATNGLSVPFDSAITNLSAYELAVSTSVSTWTPTPGVTVAARIDGSLTHRSNGATAFDFAARPLAGDTNLQMITVNPSIDLVLTSLELGNGASLPQGCSLGNGGSVFLGLTGTARISSGGTTTSGDVGGCVDLGDDTATLDTEMSGTPLTSGYPKVELSTIKLRLADHAGSFDASARSRLTVTLPRAGSVGVSAPIVFTASGFALGGPVDISQYLFGFGGSGYLFFASADDTYPTGVASIGTIPLRRGVSVSTVAPIGSTVATGLRLLGSSVTAQSTVRASAHIDPLSADRLLLDVDLGLGPTTVFDRGGFALHLDQLTLRLSASKAEVKFAVYVAGTARFPALVPGGVSSQVAVSGDVGIGPAGLSVSLRAGSWDNALGLSGLHVQGVGLQGGVGGDGLPKFGFDAAVDRLPDSLASALGYVQGTTMSLAVNLDDNAPLLAMEVGNSGGSSPVLQPLAFTGHPQLFSVTYAKLYIAPKPVSLAGKYYPAGYSAAFQGSLLGVDVAVAAQFDPAAKSLSFDATVKAFDFGPLHIGDVTMAVRASRSGLSVGIKGSAALGPYDYDIKVVRGHVGAKLGVDITIGTSSLSAFAALDVNLLVQMYLPTKTCSWGLFDGPCGFEWNTILDTDLNTGRVGFALDSSGLTVGLPYLGEYTIPFGGGSFPNLLGFSNGVGTASRSQRLLTGPSSGGAVGTGALSAGGASSFGTAPLAAPARAVSRAGAPARWDRTGSLGSPRLLPAGTVLKDGRVLLAGGLANSTTPLATAELYNPKTGGWTATGSMRTPRGNATAVVLPNGKVLVAGGASGSAETAAAETYDPRTGRWSGAGSLSQARQGAAVVELTNGTVLAIGGTQNHVPSATVDSYDPGSGRWTRLASLPTARAATTAAVLADGDVLVAGGYDRSGALATAVRYRPGAGSWSSAGTMSLPAYFASSVRLPSGDVLVAGGSGVPERYHAATGRWVRAGSPKLSTLPGTLAGLVALPNGDVVMAGGVQRNGAVTHTALYSAKTNRWTSQPAIPDAQCGARAFAVRGGVLFAGGGHATLAGGLNFQPRTGAFVFHPARKAGAAAPPTTPRRAFATPRRAPAISTDSGSAWTRPVAIGGYAAGLLLLLAAVVVLRRRRVQPAPPPVEG